MVLTLALNAFIVGAVAWFWLHCARPELQSRAANSRARHTVLGVTILTMVVYALETVVQLAAFDIPGRWWIGTITGAAWIVVVAAGYLQHYRTLIQVTASN